MLREFILGSNATGLVKTIRPGVVTVVGGEVKSLAGNLQGGDALVYGNWATPTTYLYPAATRAAWKTFINGIQTTPTPTARHHHH